MVPVETLRVGTEEMTVLCTTAETYGDLFAIELLMPPGVGPPVMHRHAPSEIYRVLEGELTFYTTDAAGITSRRVARSGDTVTVAGNTPHTIRNESEDVAIAFGVHTPGGPMESFSREAAALAAEGPPAIEDVLLVAERNGIELLGPVAAVVSA